MRSAIHKLKLNYKANVRGKSANHRIRLTLKSRRRCAAGSPSSLNEQQTA